MPSTLMEMREGVAFTGKKAGFYFGVRRPALQGAVDCF
jgi:hypothetical protein